MTKIEDGNKPNQTTTIEQANDVNLGDVSLGSDLRNQHLNAEAVAAEISGVNLARRGGISFGNTAQEQMEFEGQSSYTSAQLKSVLNYTSDQNDGLQGRFPGGATVATAPGTDSNFMYN